MAQFWAQGSVDLSTMQRFYPEFVYTHRVNLTSNLTSKSISNVKIDGDSTQQYSLHEVGHVRAVRVTRRGHVYEELVDAAAVPVPADHTSVPAFFPDATEPEAMDDNGSKPGTQGTGTRRLRWMLGTDDRQQLGAQDTGLPWYAAGMLEIKDEEGSTYTCSGALIAPSTVLTAAHVRCARCQFALLGSYQHLLPNRTRLCAHCQLPTAIVAQPLKAAAGRLLRIRVH
jgi:hypothetical protein